MGDASALPEEELDAVARRLLGHELRFLAVLGVDDLVLAVLVTISARQVALVRHVHHHRGERDDPRAGRARSVHDRHHRQHSREAGLGFVLVTDRASLQQIGDGIPDDRRIEPSGQRGNDRRFRPFLLGHRTKHCRCRLVEREDRRARNQIQEFPLRRLEQMELTRR